MMIQYKDLSLLITFFVASLYLVSCGEDEIDKNPNIQSLGFTASSTYASDTIQVTCVASDSEGSSLVYDWMVEEGTFEEVEGNSINWFSPNLVGEFVIRVNVSNSHGTISESITVELTQEPLEFEWVNLGAQPMDMDILWRSTAFVINNKAYVGTGRTLDNIDRTSEFWEYNASSNEWTTKADFIGGPVSSITSVAIGDKGYIVTRPEFDSNFGELWEYDPSLDEWSQKKDHEAVDLFGGSAFSVEGLGYFVGIMNQLWEYTPSTDSWLRLEDYPGTVAGRGAAFTINEVGYFGTGGSPNTDEFYAYDLNGGDWKQIANFPTKIDNSISYSVRNIGIVGLGQFESNGINRLWFYGPASDSWSEIASFPGSSGLVDATGFVINDECYLLHGLGTDGNVWKLTVK